MDKERKIYEKMVGISDNKEIVDIEEIRNSIRLA